MCREEGLTVRHAEKQPSAQKSPHGERPKWETTRVAAVCKNLQCEGASLRAGMRYCAEYSEHRVSTRLTNAAECRRVLRNACPLERRLEYRKADRRRIPLLYVQEPGSLERRAPSS